MKSLLYSILFLCITYPNLGFASAAAQQNPEKKATEISKVAKEPSFKAMRPNPIKIWSKRTYIIRKRPQAIKIKATKVFIDMPRSIKDAIETADLKALSEAIEKKPHLLHSRDEEHNTPLILTQIQSIQDGLDRTLISNYLIDRGSDTEAVNKEGMTTRALALSFYRIKK